MQQLWSRSRYIIQQAEGSGFNEPVPKDSRLDTLNSKTYPYIPKHTHKYPHIPIVFEILKFYRNVKSQKTPSHLNF